MDKLSRNCLIIGAVTITTCIIGTSIGHAGTTANDDIQQSHQQLMKAMQKSCSTIGDRIKECYTGNNKECKRLNESIPWFTNQYKLTPEIACPYVKDYSLSEGE